MTQQQREFGLSEYLKNDLTAVTEGLGTLARTDITDRIAPHMGYTAQNLNAMTTPQLAALWGSLDRERLMLRDKAERTAESSSSRGLVFNYVSVGSVLTGASIGYLQTVATIEPDKSIPDFAKKVAAEPITQVGMGVALACGVLGYCFKKSAARLSQKANYQAARSEIAGANATVVNRIIEKRGDGTGIQRFDNMK